MRFCHERQRKDQSQRNIIKVVRLSVKTNIIHTTACKWSHRLLRNSLIGEKAEQALGKTPQSNSTFGCHIKSMAQCERAIAVLSRVSAGRQSALLLSPTTVASLVHCGCGIYSTPPFLITVPWF